MRKEIGGQCSMNVFSILVILMELWDLTLCLFCSTDAPSAEGMKEQPRTLPAQTFQRRGRRENSKKRKKNFYDLKLFTLEDQ